MANNGQTEGTPSAKQLVFLAMIAAVVAVIIFLCGVLVGRGVPARPPTEPVPTGVDSSGFGAFGSADSGMAIDPSESGSPLDDLSYFGRLHSTEPAPERLGRPLDAPDRGAAVELDGRTAARIGLADATGTAFVLQVTALMGGAEAGEVAAALVAKGYPAFVVDPTPVMPAAMYRVRVGPYAERGEAERVGHRLETEEQFHPWVIQP